MLLLHNESLENFSYENKFNLHENEPVDRTYFNLNCFALRLVLSRRQKVTQK